MTAPSQQKYPPFLKPCLRIFLSVDIVGSTNFKQFVSAKTAAEDKRSSAVDADGHPGERWLFPILEFYDRMTSRFAHEWQRLSGTAKDHLSWPDGDPPKLWKAVGDELIFTKVLRSYQEAFICVAALRRTVIDFREVIKRHSSGLDLKCSAWIADFPVNNAEVLLTAFGRDDAAVEYDGDPILANLKRLQDNYEGDGGARDYIGPSIDTGFRVASLSTPRKFVLAADLSLLLATALTTMPAPITAVPRLTFYYEGRIPLKGVTNGVPYPVFWVDCATPNDLGKIEDELEGRQPVEPGRVKDFCEHFLKKQEGTHITHPYIASDVGGLFSRMPADQVQKLDGLARYWEAQSRRRDMEQRAAIEDGQQADPLPDLLPPDALSSGVASTWQHAEDLVRTIKKAQEVSGRPIGDLLEEWVSSKLFPLPGSRDTEPS